jgi:TP901 family phage tail tape measure protein
MAENIQINFIVGGNAFTKIDELKVKFSKLSNIFNAVNAISFDAISNNFGRLNDMLKNLTAPGAQFEQQIADLSAITGIAGDDLKELEKASREMGKASGLGASGAAEAFKLLASNIDIAKMGGVEGLKALQKETITLAQSSGVDLPMAADTMSAAINQFQLQASDAARVINVLAAGAKYGAAEVPHLADSLKYVGPVAGAAGVSIEQTVGALEVLSQSAIRGSQSGTDLSAILVKMQSVLGIDIGQVGLPAALEALKPKLKDVTFLTKTFGLENLKSIQTLIVNADQVKVMEDRVTGTNVAYEQASIRLDTYSTKMAKLKAWFEDVKIAIFNTTEKILPFVDVAANAILITSNLGGAMQAMSVIAKTSVVSGIMAAVKATWAWNVALWSNPITWLVALIIAGVAIIVAELYGIYKAVQYVWTHFEKFRGFLFGLWESIKAVFTNIGKLVRDVFGGLGEMLIGVVTLDFTKIGSGWKMLTGAFSDFGSKVGNAWTEGFSEGIRDFNHEKTAGKYDEGKGMLIETGDESRSPYGKLMNMLGGSELTGSVKSPIGGSELTGSVKSPIGGSELTGSVKSPAPESVITGGGGGTRVINILENGSLIRENNNVISNSANPQGDMEAFRSMMKSLLLGILNDTNQMAAL